MQRRRRRLRCDRRFEPAIHSFLLVTRPWIVAALSAVVVILVSSTVPLSVHGDQAFQLKAAQQTLTGESPLANAITLADPADLTVATPGWITAWPPSTQVAAFPQMRAGVPIGVALRRAAACMLLVGAIGWLRWWAAFVLPRPWLVVVALLLPWERYASHGLFDYSAEILTFGAVPWVLLAARRVARYAEDRPHLDVAFIAGLAAGALYCVQYSAVFASIGCAAFLVSRRGNARRAEAFSFMAGASIPVALLTISNHNLADAARRSSMGLTWALDPRVLVYLPGNLGNMAADAASLFTEAFAPTTGAAPFAVALLGVPAGLTLAWLLTRAETLEERLAAAIAAVSAVLMLAAWIGWQALDFAAPHLAGAAMASLPAAIAVTRRQWPAFTTPARAWLLVAAGIFVGLPWIYGPVSVVAAVTRVRDYRTTDTRLYNPLAATRDLPAAVTAFRQACATTPPPMVWYVPDPLTALELSGPMLVTDPASESIEQLGAHAYRGPVSICALLPRGFETNGKGLAIRRSFADISTWQRVPIETAQYDLWIGVPRQP